MRATRLPFCLSSLPRTRGLCAGDDERARVRLASVEGARALNVGLARGDEADAALLDSFELHQGHALRRVVEPLAHDDLPIVRRGRVGLALLQTLLDQRISQKPVAELRRFERRLVALRRGEYVHALLVGELRQPLRVHGPAPLLVGFESLPGIARAYDEDGLGGV